jgi:hypothetical protein
MATTIPTNQERVVGRKDSIETGSELLDWSSYDIRDQLFAVVGNDSQLRHA